MYEYQAGQEYISFSGCTMIKVTSANKGMCGVEIFDFDFDINHFVSQGHFILPHAEIADILDDEHDFDPDDGEAEIIFIPEFL